MNKRALLQRMTDARRKARADRPVVEKLAIAEELRDLQEALATSREQNRAKQSPEPLPVRSRPK